MSNKPFWEAKLNPITMRRDCNMKTENQRKLLEENRRINNSLGSYGKEKV